MHRGDSQLRGMASGASRLGKIDSIKCLSVEEVIMVELATVRTSEWKNGRIGIDLWQKQRTKYQSKSSCFGKKQ